MVLWETKVEAVMNAASANTRGAERRSSIAARLLHRLRGLGPYVLIEILLPGGTLIALLLYVYQHKPPTLQATAIPPQGVVHSLSQR